MGHGKMKVVGGHDKHDARKTVGQSLAWNSFKWEGEVRKRRQK
jgi:hypothetical protein